MNPTKRRELTADRQILMLVLVRQDVNYGVNIYEPTLTESNLG